MKFAYPLYAISECKQIDHAGFERFTSWTHLKGKSGRESIVMFSTHDKCHDFATSNVEGEWWIRPLNSAKFTQFLKAVRADGVVSVLFDPPAEFRGQILQDFLIDGLLSSGDHPDQNK